MAELLVVVTMDCERPNDTGDARVSGPPGWGESARFIEGYAAIAATFGFPVSFFLHPELARPHRDLFLGLEAAGCTIDGLHLHPWKYAPDRYLAHFGHLAPADQRAILEAAIAEYAEGLGRRPAHFRPGTFSASDATFRVLHELGFQGGSVSVPGRVFADLGAVWAGCPPDPHRADGAFRLRPGVLPFANMPLSVDLSRTLARGCRRWHPDLRPDQEVDDWPGLVDRVIGQIADREPAVPVVNIVTHNDHDYTSPADPVRVAFAASLELIVAAAARRGLDCRGATLATVCAMVQAAREPPPAFVAV